MFDEKPLAPEELDEQTEKMIRKAMEKSPHDFNYCYPTLLHWLIHELTWSKTWQTKHMKDLDRIQRDHSTAIYDRLKEMLDGVEHSVYKPYPAEEVRDNAIEDVAKQVEVFLLTDKYKWEGNIPSIIRGMIGKDK